MKEKLTERTKRITIRVTPAQHDAIKKQAGARGLSINDYVFNCLVESSKKTVLKIPNLLD